MNRTTAIIIAGLLATGLMVVASYASNVWAGVVSSGSSSSAVGGGGTSHEASSSAGGSTGGAGGLINICGNTVKILGACSSGEDK